MRPVLVPVVVGSELYGESTAVGRRFYRDLDQPDTLVLVVQCNDLVPLGSVVTVHFAIGETDDELVARAEVTDHLLFEVPGMDRLMVRGMRLAFLDFDENLPLSLPGSRVLH